MRKCDFLSLPLVIDPTGLLGRIDRDTKMRYNVTRPMTLVFEDADFRLWLGCKEGANDWGFLERNMIKVVKSAADWTLHGRSRWVYYLGSADMNSLVYGGRHSSRPVGPLVTAG